jgi:hypothetical protein
MALTPPESRAALTLVTGAGVAKVETILGSLDGSGAQQRAALLDLVPATISLMSDGSSALAADWYDDLREEAEAAGRFVAEPVVLDRGEKIGRMVAWASAPLLEPDGDAAKVALRLLPEVQKEIASPFRDTITTNQRRDPSANGWRRVSSGGCKFCRMLAERGAVYKAETARFASHGNCHCTAEPVFNGQVGPEANVVQYVASQRRKTAADRARVRAYLDSMPD